MNSKNFIDRRPAGVPESRTPASGACSDCSAEVFPSRTSRLKHDEMLHRTSKRATEQIRKDFQLNGKYPKRCGIDSAAIE
ncbi:hypothetical protein QE152_g27415 [Popillia japonica]|uniref:C2H2-type domain-containing protein n=1 Tax=Popillia japonica TaxID=7064 RepID=A0AAW1JUR4_POPJA